MNFRTVEKITYFGTHFVDKPSFTGIRILWSNFETCKNAWCEYHTETFLLNRNDCSSVNHSFRLSVFRTLNMSVLEGAEAGNPSVVMCIISLLIRKLEPCVENGGSLPAVGTRGSSSPRPLDSVHNTPTPVIVRTDWERLDVYFSKLGEQPRSS